MVLGQVRAAVVEYNLEHYYELTFFQDVLLAGRPALAELLTAEAG
jgi:hypothetical protein